jgi:hypothetical protein
MPRIPLDFDLTADDSDDDADEAPDGPATFIPRLAGLAIVFQARGDVQHLAHVVELMRVVRRAQRVQSK